ASDAQDRAASAIELLGNDAEHTLTQLDVFHKLGIEPRDRKIRLRQRHLDVAKHVAKQRKVLKHALQQRGIFKALHPVAHTEPAGKSVSTLHPSEHPRNRAKIRQSFGLAATRRP